MLTVADLFCGTGGFSQGFMQAGDFTVVLGIDIKKDAVETFSANNSEAIAIADDIRNVRVRDVADRLGGVRDRIDVIVGGPPCQGFSSIRPYRSINEDDRRNNLFEQYTVFVNFFRPRFLVFENVVGLMNHKGGKTLEAIRDSIEAMGYSTDLAVLNAVNYGVPQRRERIILLGRRGKAKPSLPAATHHFDGRGMGGSLAKKSLPLFEPGLPLAVTIEKAISDLPPVNAGKGATGYRDDVEPSEYARARRKNAKTVTLHSATAHTPRMLEIIRLAGTNRWALPEGLTTSGFSSCYSRLLANEPCITITVNFVHPASNRCIHPTQDRALTPREGARIQSFDDDFVFCGSRTQIVKQIGEAVPPLLGRAIAEAVKSQV
ncbi:MAG: DNA cytosine methyltransferase [Planctomycetales bacterium]|nr:DNA cytosine methyltransferase [Planctomycetales bacterium]